MLCMCVGVYMYEVSVCILCMYMHVYMHACSLCNVFPPVCSVKSASLGNTIKGPAAPILR